MLTEAAREQMVNQQVRAWDVLDPRALDVLRRLPRERFVPDAYREMAFADTGIPLPHREHMLSPKIVGRILQAMDLQPSESVLEIGTGSGFLTAAMAMQAARVRSMDRHGEFISAARQRIAALGLGAVELQEGDALAAAALGSGSYDAIVITASLPVYDDRFQQRLAVGGRLFVIVGSAPIMDARLVRRVSAAEFTQQALFETVIAPLVGAAPPPPFRF